MGCGLLSHLRRIAAAHGQVISDPGSLYLEVISPELVLLWIAEDLTIDKGAAATILSSSLASYHGRLVLEEDFVQEQEQHRSLAHSGTWGAEMARDRRQGRKQKQPIR